MIGRFRTVDSGQIRPELALIAARARTGRGGSQIEIHDLTIRCLLGAQRAADGAFKGLAPQFDAIAFAPDYSWRCGKFDEIKFTGDIDAMECWLAARAAAGATP